jgi:hypothetical protein
MMGGASATRSAEQELDAITVARAARGENDARIALVRCAHDIRLALDGWPGGKSTYGDGKCD